MKRSGHLPVLFLLAFAVRPVAAATCSITATDVVFGNYTGITVRITGTIAVKCTANAQYYVGLNAGGANGATITNRSMTGPGSSLLGYGLFSDAAYTTNWGNSSGTGWMARLANGNSQAFTVYAQIPASEYAAAGSFTDTITATVTYDTSSTVSTTFTVTANNTKACTISANPLAFGAYTGLQVNSTSTISVICTQGTAYDVGLDAGTSSGSTVTNRSMTGPGPALLGYSLLRDSAQTLNWGSTVGTDTVTGTGSGAVQSVAVYGYIPAGQNVTPGNYTDTITATITY